MSNKTVSIDELIASLQAQKAAGIAGSTPVVVSALDNNGKRGFMKTDVAVRPVALSKDEYSKGWTLCRVVSRGGVTALVIA